NSTDYLLLRYQPPVRQQAIVTTCFTGMGTAEKLADLLRDTLSLWMPDIRIIPCDYNGLKANGLNESVIKDYSVIMIFGTMDPQIGKIPFVNVGEAMISECGDNKLYHVLSGFIPEQHMEQVNDQLIKNFSLQRVLDYLTILNPERVLTNVEAFIGSLERFLHTKFPNPVKLLLYVHISCLIERLITKKPVPDYKNRPNFAKKQKKFIKVVKDGFSVIEKMYSVEISTEEIGYIYDIVTAKPATSVFEQEL
ncbi:MAG: PRD domain-containing protein, partial [Bacillota bacterium]|nr:PRD domain-containing protein [Bacillota bacterium]